MHTQGSCGAEPWFIQVGPRTTSTTTSGKTRHRHRRSPRLRAGRTCSSQPSSIPTRPRPSCPGAPPHTWRRPSKPTGRPTPRRQPTGRQPTGRLRPALKRRPSRTAGVCASGGGSWCPHCCCRPRPLRLAMRPASATSKACPAGLSTATSSAGSYHWQWQTLPVPVAGSSGCQARPGARGKYPEAGRIRTR